MKLVKGPTTGAGQRSIPQQRALAIQKEINDKLNIGILEDDSTVQDDEEDHLQEDIAEVAVMLNSSGMENAQVWMFLSSFLTAFWLLFDCFLASFWPLFGHFLAAFWPLFDSFLVTF